MTEVEIESLQSQQRPDTNVYQPDSCNCAMAHGRGIYPRTNRVLERGSQQQRGHTYDQRSSDRSKPPASPADSKLNIDTRMPQPDRESVCGRRIVDGIPGQPRPSGHPRPMMIHQGMTRISTAGQWVQGYFRLAGNGPIVRSKPAIRRTRQQSALSGSQSRSEQRVYRQNHPPGSDRCRWTAKGDFLNFSELRPGADRRQ